MRSEDWQLVAAAVITALGTLFIVVTLVADTGAAGLVALGTAMLASLALISASGSHNRPRRR
jgi:hypothetical protein